MNTFKLSDKLWTEHMLDFIAQGYILKDAMKLAWKAIGKAST